MNKVRTHVYNLLTKDELVEIPYFNCNSPIGQCAKVVNGGCHVLETGTGAYHVDVEVNPRTSQRGDLHTPMYLTH